MKKVGQPSTEPHAPHPRHWSAGSRQRRLPWPAAITTTF